MQDSTKVYRIIRRRPPGIRRSPLHLLLFPSVSQDSRFSLICFVAHVYCLNPHLGWLHPMEARWLQPPFCCHHTPFVQFLTTVGNPTTSDLFIAFPSGKPETRSEMTYILLIFHIYVTYCYVVSYKTRRVVSALLFPPFFIQQPEKIMIKIKSSW